MVLPDRNLAEALRSIGEERKTGSLTVHFGQGGVTSIEWQQRSVVLGRWPFRFADAANGK